ncbi:hypothetical protein OIU84_004298 [Salix udensis]|uniref:Uncharacterized protein n=1 Tax=Salix udensis TaxID=889485 RepID=A0AAD6K3Z9_9ROSI|nr:hypothetical protein OIU84_004298 [Salix udensis]
MFPINLSTFTLQVSDGNLTPAFLGKNNTINTSLRLTSWVFAIEFQGLKIQRKKKMFTCIACTKPVAEDGRGEEGGARGSGTPSTKEAVKSLTSQVPPPPPPPPNYYYYQAKFHFYLHKLSNFLPPCF